ncbi:hypothetical protein HK102_006083 [Quaeritorhiza haematococci]|nr:hypothetical protein HK102_006083 [Quaeritorhiza haematococci]
MIDIRTFWGTFENCSNNISGSLISVEYQVLLAIVLAAQNQKPDVYPAHLRQQADVSRTRNKGESGVYRAKLTPHGTPLVGSPEKDVRTVYDFFQASVKRNPNNKFLGRRVNNGPYVWQTYADVAERITNAGSGLIQLCGLESAKENMVGIFLKNMPEWVIIDQVCCAYSLISVPMYDTFDEDSLAYIITHTGVTTAAVSTANLEKLLNIKGRCALLKHVVVVDSTTISDDKQQQAKALGVTLHTLKELETHGKANPKPHVPPSPSDVFTALLASAPKGAMLTHANVVAASAGFLVLMPKEHILSNTDVHLSYLPLAHMMERDIVSALTYCGASIGFFRGEVTQLFDDILELKPTLFPSVPRLLIRLYDRVMNTVNSGGGVKKFLFETAFDAKKRMLRNGSVTKSSFWDKLVFKKIQARLGGNVRLMITGAAPISPEVVEFLRIVMGCQVLEGYGQTESSASGTLSTWGDYQFPYGSHIGVPFACSEVKLVDVPGMSYFAEDKPNPRGEICIRGLNVMKGYYKAPEKTAEALDADGWLHTGDVGELLPNGTLKIIDRVKNLFKLQQGEYVAPEKVEMKVKTDFVMQSFIYGDSLQSALVGIVVPDPEVLLPWAKANGLGDKSLEELCADPTVTKNVLDGMIKMGKQNKLHSFELPKAIRLHAEPFSVDNGLLTPTFKTKRPQAKAMFLKEIDEMYKSLEK